MDFSSRGRKLDEVSMGPVDSSESEESLLSITEIVDVLINGVSTTFTESSLKKELRLELVVVVSRCFISSYIMIVVEMSKVTCGFLC